jgi:hypothetical protein
MTQPDPTAPETADTATVQQPEGAAPDTAEQPKPTDTVDYWKQMARQNEARAKANAEAAKRLREIEDRDLSELQRAQKQVTETAAELAEIRRQNAFLAKGVPVDLIPPANARADDMAAFADRLLAWKQGSAATPAPVQQVSTPAGPRPDPSQGAQPVDTKAAAEAAYEQIKAQNGWGYLTTNQTRR